MQLDAHRLGPTRFPDSVVPYRPFSRADGFRTHWWVGYLVGNGESLEWWAYRDDGPDDVARVEVKLNPRFEHSYQVSAPANGFIEIVFIEVRQGQQRRGVGRDVVSQLRSAYPGRTLAALSEEDAFWSALGWSAHLRPNVPDPHKYKTLFIAPT